MITRSVLTMAAAALLTIPLLRAQAPQPGAAPAATPPAGGTPAPATKPAASATPKPVSSSEAKALSDLFAAMHFHLHMAAHGRQKDKDDKDMVSYATKNDKEITDLYTPLVSAAQLRQMKNIQAEPSKADKEAVGKVGKEKGEKWKSEYYELLAKQGKRNARTAENAVKSLSDPEVKAIATKVVAAINAQADEAETKLKELKAAKK